MPANGVKSLEELNAEFLRRREEAAQISKNQTIEKSQSEIDEIDEMVAEIIGDTSVDTISAQQEYSISGTEESSCLLKMEEKELPKEETALSLKLNGDADGAQNTVDTVVMPENPASAPLSEASQLQAGKVKTRYEKKQKKGKRETKGELISAEESSLQETEVDVSEGSKKIVKVLTDVVFYVVIVAILVGSAAFALNDSPGKSIFGFRFYNILTASMAPAYQPNDMVVVKMADASEIAKDDIITFMPGNERKSYLTHRVIAVIPDYNGTGLPAFQTKGDANESADSFIVKPDQIIGKVVFGVPILGGIVKFIGNNVLLVIIIVVLVILLCVFLRALFDVGRTNEKKSQTKEDPVKSKN